MEQQQETHHTGMAHSGWSTTVTSTTMGQALGLARAAPNASAKVEIASTTQGFLTPKNDRHSEREAIAAPAVGLVIYNTTSNCLNFYVGSNWHETCGSSSTIPPAKLPSMALCVLCNRCNRRSRCNQPNDREKLGWIETLGASRAATSI